MDLASSNQKRTKLNIDKSAQTPPEIIKIEGTPIRIEHKPLGKVEIITKAGSTKAVVSLREISLVALEPIEDIMDNKMEVSILAAKVCKEMEIYKEIQGSKTSTGMVKEQIQERRELDQTGIWLQTLLTKTLGED